MLKLSDIAAHSGVSITTVSFVLNNRSQAEHISEKTRQKVLLAAEELGYRSNQWARAVRTGNTRMLGMLGGNTEMEQVGRILSGALSAADEQGYTLKILLSDSIGNTAQQIIRRSSELRLMGILALHLSNSFLDELHNEARKTNTPLVLMDSWCDNDEIAQVMSDETGGINAGIDYLVKLGHRKIAFISGTANSATPREAAFTARLAHYGLPMPKDYIQGGLFGNRDHTYAVALTLMTMPLEQRPTAIMCSGDNLASATLQAAHDCYLRVPQDISVIGFGNSSISEYVVPQLTTIEQPFRDLGRTAVSVLLGMINEREQESNSKNAADTNSAPTVEAAELIAANRNLRSLPVRLIERASTAPPPH